MPETVDKMLARYGTGRHGHAHFAPSSSSGWLNCPGYLLANAVVGDTAGAEAAYGTVAHTLAEVWRGNGYRPDGHVGEVITVGAHDVTIDMDMLRYVQEFIEWCDEVPGDAFVEQRVDLSEYLPIPEQRGTADHVVCAPGVLTVTDLKMGVGVKVYVENNSQAMLYALGAFAEWDWVYGFKRIVIRICQPRLGYFGVWECDRATLMRFGEYVRQRSALAWSVDAPRTPGEKQCRFCRVSVTCPALSIHLENLADAAFGDDDLAPTGLDDLDDLSADKWVATGPVYAVEQLQDHEATLLSLGAATLCAVSGLSTELLAYRMEFVKLYRKWFAQIESELTRRVENGESVRGWQLKPGRRSYDWKDVKAAQKLLRTEIADKELYHVTFLSLVEAKKKLRALGMKPKLIAEFLATVVKETPGNLRLSHASPDGRDHHAEVDDVFETEEDDL